MLKSSMLLALLFNLGPADERIYWYFDADTALRTAERTGRPVVVLKIRADIGPDVKT